ncbi:MAG: hypothetical protein HQL07_09140 [Nitrospirae bacterium]|nr:hypothetical protein [Magnetococcales bacterium]
MPENDQLLKEKRGLGDCPQGFDFDFAFHAHLLPKHFFRAFGLCEKNAQGARLSVTFFAVFAKNITHNAMF